MAKKHTVKIEITLNENMHSDDVVGAVEHIIDYANDDWWTHYVYDWEVSRSRKTRKKRKSLP